MFTIKLKTYLGRLIKILKKVIRKDILDKQRRILPRETVQPLVRKLKIVINRTTGNRVQILIFMERSIYKIKMLISKNY